MGAKPSEYCKSLSKYERNFARDLKEIGMTRRRGVALHRIRGGGNQSLTIWDPGPRHSILRGYPNTLRSEMRKLVARRMKIDICFSFASPANNCQPRQNPLPPEVPH